MNMIICLALIAFASLCTYGQQQSKEQSSQNAPQSTAEAPVFRDPFTLKLRVDKEHYYEERFDRRIPYVADNDVYLFSGENFGVNLILNGGEVTGITYQPDLKKADVLLTFTQEGKSRNDVMMMLIIQNTTKQTLYIDALMTVPGREGVFKTSMLPVEAGLSNYESWPHPIVQLVLRNLRFSKGTGSSSAK